MCSYEMKLVITHFNRQFTRAISLPHQGEMNTLQYTKIVSIACYYVCDYLSYACRDEFVNCS